MKYIYSIVIILLSWLVVGTGLTIIFSLIGLGQINDFAIGPILGIILGIFIAYNKFKTSKKD